MAITKPSLSESEKIVYELFCDNLSAEAISKKLRVPYMTIMSMRCDIINKGYELPKINLKEEQFR